MNNYAEIKNKLVVFECLVDYAGPILLIGDINWLLNQYDATVISATIPKEELIIANNYMPKWVNEVRNKETLKTNILIITDFHKISIDKQELFLDILKNNQISSESLPDDLKIIVQADEKCIINQKVRDIVEYYEI
ncbi:MAG: hypothetical protein IJ094_01865 [Bacilli bacterium]|nr:hypothetical protein [Bacilli bacterium]